ncbi:MAG: 16S rRNA (uracil(1498)-N(3))-methyltransferase [Actinobacteria bacterium]|nr:16S rRNA (uracil(1498)-N(3))-methyltransferase [Actinomycetota bacterium]
MTTARFYVEELPPPGDRLSLEEEDHHHASRVLRLKPGHEVILLDGRGTVCRARVVDVDARRTRVEITERRCAERERPRLLLCQALLRDNRMGEVVQRNVELGVAAILPFCSRRSQRSLEEHRLQRLRRIALEASRVACRPYLPRVEGLLSWEELLAYVAGREKVLYADERGGASPAVELRGVAWEELDLVIGPEGGFTDGERASLQDAGAVPVTLGPYNLRAESAGAVLACAVRAHCGLL